MDSEHEICMEVNMRHASAFQNIRACICIHKYLYYCFIIMYNSTHVTSGKPMVEDCVWMVHAIHIKEFDNSKENLLPSTNIKFPIDTSSGSLRVHVSWQTSSVTTSCKSKDLCALYGLWLFTSIKGTEFSGCRDIPLPGPSKIMVKSQKDHKKRLIIIY